MLIILVGSNPTVSTMVLFIFISPSGRIGYNLILEKSLVTTLVILRITKETKCTTGKVPIAVSIIDLNRQQYFCSYSLSLVKTPIIIYIGVAGSKPAMSTRLLL